VVDVLKEEQQCAEKERQFGFGEVFGMAFAGGEGFVKAVGREYETKKVEGLVAELNDRYVAGDASVVDEIPGKSKVAAREADDESEFGFVNVGAVLLNPLAEFQRAGTLKPNVLAAGTDGWKHGFGTRGYEDEENVGRRFFEQFEDFVGRRRVHPVGLRDDEYFSLAFGWPVEGFLLQGDDLFAENAHGAFHGGREVWVQFFLFKERFVALFCFAEFFVLFFCGFSGVEQGGFNGKDVFDIGVHEVVDLHAVGAGSAGAGLGIAVVVPAVERAGQFEGYALFAGGFRAGEEVGMSETSGFKRFLQNTDLLFLTDYGFPAHAFLCLFR